MIQSITKKNTLYYQASLVVIMLVLTSVITYFWGLGFLDGSKSKDLHKVNFILESVQSKKPIKTIKKLVLNENNKIALSNLDILERDLKNINNTVNDSEFSLLSDELQQIKSNVASLISFTKTDKVIEIFNDRVKSFIEYVSNNNWRTLTRSSKRVLTRSSGYLNKNKLNSFIKGVETEVALMKKATIESILTDPEKKEILKKLKGFDVELNMLKRYEVKKKKFMGMAKGYSQTLNAWVKKVSPEISVQKLKLEHMGKYFILSLFGILGVSALLFIGGFVYNRRQRNNNRQKFESFIKEYVSDNLVRGKMLNLNDFSDSFKDYSSDTQKYIDKRMSFGQVFQEALPFSSMLLDESLKLEWANSHFCNDWSLDKDNIKNSNLSWDYLIKFTNLKDNDPVIEAVRNNVAGIYQVKIKQDHSEESIPFEMYVSPVRSSGETKVMVFFYPLSSLEDTINDQAKSIVDPVSRLLKEVTLRPSSLSFIDKYEGDFKQAKISNLFSSFKIFFKENDEQKERLFDEIEVLNNKMNEYEDLLTNLEHENNSVKASLDSFQNGFKKFKSSIINSFQMQSDQTEDFVVSKNIASNSLYRLENLNDRYSDITDLSQLSINSIMKMSEFKTGLKDIRSKLEESKARLSHSIGQMVHVKNKIQSNDVKLKFSNAYSKLNDEFSIFNEDLRSLEKEVLSLEVLMSKNDMLVGSFQSRLGEFDTEQESFELSQMKINLSSLDKNYDFSSSQDEVIENLKAVFGNYKDSKTHSLEIDSYLASRSNYSGFLANNDHGQPNA